MKGDVTYSFPAPLNLAVLFATIAILASSTSGLAATGTLSKSSNLPAWYHFDAHNPVTDLMETTAVLKACGFKQLLDRDDLREIDRKSTISGMSIRYGQYLHDLPVVGGGIVLRYSADGSPLSLFNSTACWSEMPAPDLRLNEAQALRITLERLAIGELRGEISIQMMVLPRGGTPHYCWKVSVPALDPLGDWDVYIDALDGKELLVENRLLYFDGSGLVFDPDPITATEDTTLRDEDDSAEAIPEEAYSEVVLPDISQDDEDRWILSGPWVDTEPTENRAALAEPEFLFDRQDDRFEEVMAYYHIDRQARYLRGLGFDDLPPAPQLVNLNGVEEDMSFFSPQTGVITTGAGGVDDAEDADVLIHEYSHALLHQIVGDWRGGDSQLLSEGLCDYLAGDRSLETAPDFRPFELYNWDGHNEFWDGRRLDMEYTYEDAIDLERHEGGQMWSSLLTEVRLLSGDRDIWNTVILDHLYALGDSVTVPQAAEALLDGDIEIADGRLRRYIVPACERRGIFPAGLYSPRITHQPLRDTEDVESERSISCRITSGTDLDPDLLAIVYQFDDSDPETTDLQQVGEDLFGGNLPAPETPARVEYYLTAADTSGVFATDPPGAPLVWHRYYAGPDSIPPVIARIDSVYDTVFPSGEINVGVWVTDNIGVDEVSLIWFHGEREPGGLAQMQQDGADSTLYVGKIEWALENWDVVQYLVTATDVAVAGNTAATRRRSFALQHEAVMDGFERPNHRWRFDGWVRTDETAQLGRWSLRDREDSPLETPRQSTAILDELWDFSPFDRATLIFREQHEFDDRVEESGSLQISADGGQSWETVVRLEGVQQWWARREIDLREYCLGRSDPITVRFVTVTPDDAADMGGWLIDNLELHVGNIVAAGRPESAQDLIPCLFPPSPNPANGMLTLQYVSSREGNLNLYDLNGRTVLRQPVKAGRGSVGVNIAGLPTGLYLLELDSDRNVPIRRVVVLK